MNFINLKSVLSFADYIGKAIKMALCASILLCTNFALARHYEHNFVFVDKSFKRDLEISIRLYRSFEKFVEPAGVPFYMVVPENDMQLFKERFEMEKAAQHIQSMPIMVTDEAVYSACGKHIKSKADQMGGWSSQQVIKMCFSRLGIARFYMTLDSDVYFTKKFPVSILFKDGMIRTYVPRSRDPMPKGWQATIDKIKPIIGGEATNRLDFTSDVGTWSSDLLDKLEVFVRTTLNNQEYDFADMIKLAPVEMQWYGSFIYARVPQYLHPLPTFFTYAFKGPRKCMPTDGFPWHYGIIDKKPGTYTNPCGKWLTRLSVLRYPYRYLRFYLFGHELD